MAGFKDKVIVGNTVLYPAVIRRFLAKSHYWLVYSPKDEKLTLSANHGDGGIDLFEIRNVSHESAEKLALGLGLKGQDSNSCTWGKWNPILTLYYDASVDAQKLRAEILKLGIPHRIIDGTYFELHTGQFAYKAPNWPVSEMLAVIRETAEKYKEELSTTP